MRTGAPEQKNPERGRNSVGTRSVPVNNEQSAANNSMKCVQNRSTEPKRRTAVLELLSREPWLIVVGLAMLVPILGIVFGTVTNHRVQIRKAELHAGLVQEMVQRGMSAEEIRTVLEASPKNAAKRCRPDSAHTGNWPSQA
jgi:hypothetical protein